MKKHGNRNDNEAEHHVYEIRDREYEDVYKYGICGEPLNDDGTSPRAQRQVRELNRAVRWRRFFANIIATEIPGRIAAKKIEDRMNLGYKEQNGCFPPGNDTEGI
jgi:hypothetical protein